MMIILLIHYPFFVGVLSLFKKCTETSLPHSNIAYLQKNIQFIICPGGATAAQLICNQ